MKKKAPSAAVETDVDPTKPYTIIELGGKPYKACFDLKALAKAEAKLVAAGYDVNLLFCLPRLNLGNTMVLLAASLMAHHPELGFDEAQDLLTRDNAMMIASAILQAWEKFAPEAGDKEDPLEPAL